MARNVNVVANNQFFVSAEENEVIDHHVVAYRNALGTHDTYCGADDHILAAARQAEVFGIQ